MTGVEKMSRRARRPLDALDSVIHGGVKPQGELIRDCVVLCFESLDVLRKFGKV